MDPDNLSFIPLLTTIAFQSPAFGDIAALLLAFLFLGISGFISASEIAFFSLTPEDKNEINEEKHRNDALIKKLLDKPEYLLATILITNNLVNVAVIMLCNYFIANVVSFGPSPVLQFLVQTVILTFLLLLFGEIMPKIYSAHNALKFCRRSAPGLVFFSRIFHPLASLLVKSTQILNKRLSQHSNLTMNDLSQALEVTDVQAKDEKEMLKGILKFGNKTVDEIMTCRVDMTDADIKIDFEELIELIVETGYSRIPVYEETEDTIKGILYIKDLLPYLNKEKNFRWQNLLRPAYFVPETKRIDDLLEEFRIKKNHIAVVVDEFGGTSGIVTMEDILEEIVGEISDEYDDEEKQYIRLDDNTYIFEGKTQLTDFFRITRIDEAPFEKMSSEAETLAGLILEIKEGFPVAKEKISYADCLFTVLEMDKRRIIKVKVKICAGEEEKKEKNRQMAG